MSRLLLATAALAASALLGACEAEEDVIVSETSDTTTDLSTEPPEVETDPPGEGDEEE